MELKWKTCIRAGTTVLILYLLIRYWGVCAGMAKTAFGAAMPLFLGCAVAYVVNILMTFLERRVFQKQTSPAMEKLRRPFCMLLAYVCIVCFAVFIVCMIVPELLTCSMHEQNTWGAPVDSRTLSAPFLFVTFKISVVTSSSAQEKV